MGMTLLIDPAVQLGKMDWKVGADHYTGAATCEWFEPDWSAQTGWKFSCAVGDAATGDGQVITLIVWTESMDTVIKERLDVDDPRMTFVYTRAGTTTSIGTGRPGPVDVDLNWPQRAMHASFTGEVYLDTQGNKASFEGSFTPFARTSTNN